MTQNNIVKKGLIVVTTLLFLTISFSPIINAHDNMILSKSIPIPHTIGNVPITILEYKPDGTVEKTVVLMASEQADNFHKEITDAQDLDTRLSIYKKYNLISQDITVDTLQAGMQEKAQRIGVIQDKLELMVKNNRRLFNRNLYVNLFCFVSGIDGLYFLIPFGSSLFTMIINWDWRPPLISFDVLDYLIGELHFESEGEFGSIDGFFDGTIKMVGFVGFVYNYWVYQLLKPPVCKHGFDGFCVYVKAKGTFS